jgi:hypothetical protein
MNVNLIVAFSAVLFFVGLFVALHWDDSSSSSSTSEPAVNLAGFVTDSEGNALASQIYVCQGPDCNYYGIDTAQTDWPGYFALVGFKAEGRTYISEFSVGQTFIFGADGKLAECRKVEERPDLSEILATDFGSVEIGSTLAFGGDPFTLSSLEFSDSADVADAQVFGFSIPTPIECSIASYEQIDSRRKLSELEDEVNGQRKLSSVGLDMWEIAFNTYQTVSGIPNLAESLKFWRPSPDVYDGWEVVDLSANPVSFTETWKQLPFWTTAIRFGKPDVDTAWDAAPTKTLTVNNLKIGKCENAGSYAKIWSKGNDVVVGFAGTDVFLTSLDLTDIGDIFDDVNGWEVKHPSGNTFHAGFLEYTDRLDQCVAAVLAALPGKNVRYITGHSLGGAAANIYPLLHPEHVPSDGVYTYGAPVTVAAGDSCQVEGKRYFNENDSVASQGFPLIIDFRNFNHNMDTAIETYTSWQWECSNRVFGVCVDWDRVKKVRSADSCGIPNNSACQWIVDCIYNIATAHLSYGDWEY